MIAVAGYDMTERVLNQAHAQLWRGVRQQDGAPVIIKTLPRDALNARDVMILRREAELMRGAPEATQMRLVEALDQGPRPVLVFEHPGGRPLTAWLGSASTQPLEQRLRLCLSITQALGRVHAQGMALNRVHPGAFWVDPASVVSLHELGMATRLSAASDGTQLAACMLPYMSPEQTGRVHQDVDERSDLYSLGVVLFEVLSGRRPFDAQDTMGWVHSHITRMPPTLQTLREDIGPVLSSIVAKLLEKAPDARYQSARGVSADLSACLDGLRSGAVPTHMTLGTQDIHTRFELPRTLFGRAEHVKMLWDAFNRAAQGDAVWLRVSGVAGVGKSALILSVQRPLVQRRGFLLRGKFDQIQSDVPYASLLQAFEGIIDRLLMESTDSLNRWRQRMVEALGENLGVIVDVLPQLEIVVGQVPVPAPLGVAEQRNRFELTFQRFVRLFCTQEHPLVLFLDDMQWADVASMRLFRMLLLDPNAGHILAVSAHRPGPIRSVEAWGQLVQEVRALEHVHTDLIELKHLSLEDLSAMLAGVFHIPREAPATTELAAILRRKTDGNPFFVRTLLGTWHEQGLVRQDLGSGRWSWEPAALEASAVDDDIVEMLVRKLKTLPEPTQRALELASCVGATFELSPLARILGQAEVDVARDLMDAILAGLIQPVDEQHQYVSISQRDSDAVALRVRYRFEHDRVQQAVYSMLDASQTQQHHLNIGRHLLDAGATFDRHERLFDVVSQLNLGRALMAERSERVGLAQLNHRASIRARDALAYEFALGCARAGLSCLGEDAWRAYPELAFDLTVALAQSANLSGEREEAQRHFELAQRHSATKIQRAQVYAHQVELAALQNDHAHAVACALKGFDLLGFKTAQEPSLGVIVSQVMLLRVRRAGKTREQIVGMPEARDERIVAIMRLIGKVAASSHFVSDTLFPALILKAMNLTFKHGHTEVSSMIYASAGLILTAVLNQPEHGRLLADSALELGQRFGDRGRVFYTSALFVVGGLTHHWTRSVEGTLRLLSECIEQGQACGELAYTGYAITVLADALLYAGAELAGASGRFERDAALLEHMGDLDSLNMFTATRRTFLALRGLPDGLPPDGQEVQGAWVDQMSQSVNRNPYITYTYGLALLCAHGGFFERGLELCQRVLPLPESTLGLLMRAQLLLVEAICCAGLHPGAPTPQRTKLRSTLLKARGQFRRWARHSPEAFGHRLELLDALAAFVDGNAVMMEQGFERVVEQADPHIAGLAASLYAYALSQRGRSVAAKAWAEQARLAYQAWGAGALVEQLERTYALKASAEALPYEETVAPASGAGRSVEGQLDLQTVIQATQALSAELQQERLLGRLIELAIQNAGAQRGVILLRMGAEDALHVVAQGDSSRVDVLERPIELDAFEQLPRSVVRFVERSGQDVVLTHAHEQGQFTLDPYVRAQQSKSVLASALVHQGRLKGVLFLENNLSPGAFTPGRLDVLNVLTTQLAVSLENAEMYADLERARQELEARVQARTKDLEDANVGLQFEVAQRREAQARALDASASKSLFLANMSHELRTPLNAIIGYSEMMHEDALDDGNQMFVQDLDKVLLSSRHLMRLINDVLDLSKIEASKMELNSEAFSTRQIVEEVVQAVRPLVQKNGNEMVVDSCDVQFYVDRTKLVQVLMNLISNASKFTENGHIHLRCARQDDWIMLEVQDTGIGMDEAQLGRLFKAFSQAKSTTASEYGGTGLGLALSRQLCELMGGSISVQSQLDAGSTFRVRLPMVAPDKMP